MEFGAMRETEQNCLLSELKEKEVIAVDGGKRLGRVSDVEVDLREGCITALVLPCDGGRISFFERQEELYIPWDKIEQIGEDVVLVKAGTVTVHKEKSRFCFHGKKE